MSGRDYPRSYAELRAWFDEDWKCRDWLRWPDRFVCPHCMSGTGWRLADERWKCGGCDRKVSATAGTIFDKTRTPLTVLFAAGWRMVGDKVGGLGHAAAARDGAGLLPDGVGDAAPLPVGDGAARSRPATRRRRGRRAFLGGPEPGMPGRGALGKVLFAGAVEREQSGFGRARPGIIP